MVFEDTFSGLQAGKSAGMKVAVMTTSHPAEQWNGYDADLILNNYKEADMEKISRLFSDHV